jgi:hypothetical protein
MDDIAVLFASLVPGQAIHDLSDRVDALEDALLALGSHVLTGTLSDGEAKALNVLDPHSDAGERRRKERGIL